MPALARQQAVLRPRVVRLARAAAPAAPAAPRAARPTWVNEGLLGVRPCRDMVTYMRLVLYATPNMSNATAYGIAAASAPADHVPVRGPRGGAWGRGCTRAYMPFRARTCACGAFHTRGRSWRACTRPALRGPCGRATSRRAPRPLPTWTPPCMSPPVCLGLEISDAPTPSIRSPPTCPRTRMPCPHPPRPRGPRRPSPSRSARVQMVRGPTLKVAASASCPVSLYTLFLLRHLRLDHKYAEQARRVPHRLHGLVLPLALGRLAPRAALWRARRMAGGISLSRHGIDRGRILVQQPRQCPNPGLNGRVAAVIYRPRSALV